MRCPQSFNFSVVAEENKNVNGTGYIDMSKLLDPRNFKSYRGLALERLDTSNIEQL